MRVDVILLLLCAYLHTSRSQCVKSVTEYQTFGVSAKNVCAGQLIFDEEFNNLDTNRWQHEVSLTGWGNGEFEYYTNDRRVSYSQNGVLHINPHLLSADKGDAFLSSGTIDLGSQCTNGDDSGCRRTGTRDQILNPILSARMQTSRSFSFKYGKFEARAKMPGGKWLWPAIWLLPTSWVYGGWPRSGEIDVLESRGNVDLGYPNVASSTLHWGPDAGHNMWSMTHYERNDGSGYENGFHLFQLEWTPDHLVFKVDNQVIGTVTPPNGGFWQLGNLDKSGLPNPWAGHSKMAPFDENFYIIINLAVGGTNGFFPETNGKPWKNGINRFVAMTQFWNARSGWLDSWQMSTDHSHLQVDYVKVWAL